MKKKKETFGLNLLDDGDWNWRESMDNGYLKKLDDGTWRYTNGDGSEYLVIDLDGDGIPDSFLWSHGEVGFTNENNDSFSDDDNWNEIDGMSDMDNGGEHEYEPCPICGKYGCSGNCGGSNSNESTESSNKMQYDTLPKIRIPYLASSFPGYVKGERNCKQVSDKILRQILGQNANIGSPSNVMQLYTENAQGKLVITQVGYSKTVVDEINRHLEAGRPILIGVNHSPKMKINNDKTTDHFMVIIGRGYDEERGQLFFHYIETGRDGLHANDALSTDLRLYYDEENERIYGKRYNFDSGGKIYDITQIRPNFKLFVV